jgi:YkoY family integral membrane protein
MFGQTFDPHDLAVIAVLIVLEGVLSIDNALVLGLLARRLPKHLQGKALTYGLIGAFAFRLLAIAAASYLLHWRIAKLLGGAYLIYVALKHFLFEAPASPEKIAVDERGQPIPVDAPPTESPRSGKIDYAQTSSAHARAFWLTVGVIELTDIAFAIDSIVAAIGVVGPPPPNQRHPKLWVVLVGGMLGVVLMRFAAVIFIKLLEKFPRFETSAYLLVLVIGLKLTADWGFNTPGQPDRADFHSPDTWTFWAFWTLMLGCFLIGFVPKRKT